MRRKSVLILLFVGSQPDKTQYQCLRGGCMVLASGTHGPVLESGWLLAIQVALIGAAFLLLTKPSKNPRREVLLLSSIVLFTVALRVAMQPLPNVQPVTMACLVVGARLGLRRGVAFAIMVTLLSNMVISDGWWTLFQASGWAMVAAAGAKFLNSEGALNMKILLYLSVVTSLLFDWWVSLSIIESGTTFTDFMFYLANGLTFDLLHIFGTMAFALRLAPALSDLISEDKSLTESAVAVGENDVVIG